MKDNIIEIGGVSLDISHPKAFASGIEKYSMNMRYAYEYDDGFRTADEVNWFVNRFKLDGVAKSIGEMAEKVDIGFVQSCNWDRHIEQAMPFINRGKSVFIDKPIVGSVRDINRLRRLSADGAKIMGSSTVRYCREIQDFLAESEEERGKVLTVYMTSGIDDFSYSVHAVEGLSAIAQAKAVKCRYLGEAVRDGKRCQSYGIDFENGVQGIYSACLDGWQPFAAVIVTTKKVVHFEIDLEHMYVDLLEQISHELRNDGKSAMADVDTLVNCIEIMLCGKKSRDEKNGAEVAVSELDESDAFDGAAYEESYSRRANRRIYAD